MSLPTLVRLTEDVEFPDGTTMTVHGLTRAEVLGIADFRTPDGEPTVEQAAAFEAYLIAKGTDTTTEAAAAWCASTDSAAVDLLTTAIARVSGLAKDGQPDPKPSTNGGSLTATSMSPTSS